MYVFAILIAKTYRLEKSMKSGRSPPSHDLRLCLRPQATRQRILIKALGLPISLSSGVKIQSTVRSVTTAALLRPAQRMLPATANCRSGPCFLPKKRTPSLR